MIKNVKVGFSLSLTRTLLGSVFVLFYFAPKFFVNFLRLRKLLLKHRVLLFQRSYLRFRGRILRLKIRHFNFLARQSLLKDSGKRNFFEYIRDYSHSVFFTS